jgi:hypothetical protein
MGGHREFVIQTNQIYILMDVLQRVFRFIADIGLKPFHDTSLYNRIAVNHGNKVAYFLAN